MFFLLWPRSSHPDVFCKKVVLKYFAKFTRKHLCQSLFFNKVADLSMRLYWKRESGTDTFLHDETLQQEYSFLIWFPYCSYREHDEELLPQQRYLDLKTKSCSSMLGIGCTPQVGTRRRNWYFPLRISSVNVTKSAVSSLQ